MEREHSKDKKLKVKGVLRGLLISAIYFVICANSVFAAGTGQEVITKAVSLLSTGGKTLGGILSVWSLIQLGIAFKESNGPQQHQAIAGVIGGAIIVGASQYLSTLQIDFTT